MRKTLLVAIIFVFAISGISIPSATGATSIAGSTCKKLNSLTHVGGFTYSCVKSGNKLIWKKKSVDHISSSSSSSIDSQETPSSQISSITSSAYKAFDHDACRKPHSNIAMNYLIGPSYKSDMVSQQKKLLEQAASCLNEYFDRKINLTVFLGTEKDYDFMASQTTNGQPIFNADQLGWSKWMMERDAPKPNSQRGGASGSAGWNLRTDSAWMIIIDASVNVTPNFHMASHEFAHILQSYSKSKLLPLWGDFPSESPEYVNLSPWFWEGTGELFSSEITKSNVGAFDWQMADIRTQGKESPSLNKISSNEQVIYTFQRLEGVPDQESKMMLYAIGSVLCEYILGTYGYDKYIQIMKNTAIYKDFNDNLLSVINMGEKDLYAKAAPFVLSQWMQTKFD